MSGNQLPDITITRDGGTITMRRGLLGVPRQLDAFMPADRAHANESMSRAIGDADFAARLWDAAEPALMSNGRWRQTTLSEALRVIESEPMPPEPLRPDIVADDEPDDRRSAHPFQSCCGRAVALGHRPDCSEARDTAEAIVRRAVTWACERLPDWSLQRMCGWLIESLRDWRAGANPVGARYLVTTGGVPALVGKLEGERAGEWVAL